MHELGGLAAISADGVVALQNRTGCPVRRVHVGIDNEAFARGRIPRTALHTLGYGAVLDTGSTTIPDNKRGYLAIDLATTARLPLIAPTEPRTYWNYRAMADFYRRFEVLLSTSVVEGGPYAPLEAAACGIPSIVTDCGVMAEFFAQGGGTVLPVDAAQFREGALQKIEEYRASPELLQYDQAMALQAAERRSWANVIHEWRALFLSVARPTAGMLPVFVPPVPAPSTPVLRGAWDQEIWTDTVDRDAYHLATMDLQDPLTVVDVGAHTGSFVVAAKRRWPNAKVVALEPDPDNLQVLGRNTAHLSDVHIIAAAGGEGAMSTQLFYPVPDKVNGNSGMGTLTPTMDTPITVTVRELPEVIATHGGCCDLLKMDCEGAEVAILRTIQRAGLLPHIRHIVGEWHGLDNRDEVARRLEPTHTITWVYGTPTLGLFYATRTAQHVPLDWGSIDQTELPQAQAIAQWFRTQGVRSVYDIGCGPGTYVNACRAAGLLAYGCDTDARAELLGEGFVRADILDTNPLPLLNGLRTDAALCLEVGEHCPAAGADRVVARCIEAARLIVFSSALEWQSGYGHINCQPKSYWAERFVQQGCTFDPVATKAVIAAVQANPPWLGWFVNNVMVFRH
jgi:FkbM family methyltransferase